MTNLNHVRLRNTLKKLGVAIGLVWLSNFVSAQNPVYQDFFFNVCAGNPTGNLGARCASTPGGGGDISGDSESSLNPSQSY